MSEHVCPKPKCGCREMRENRTQVRCARCGTFVARKAKAKATTSVAA